MNLFRKGRIAERKVVNRLKEIGFTNIIRTHGSRGPYDIRARSPSRVKTYIQVKSGSATISREEVKRLRKVAKERGGAAAYIHYDGRGKMKWRWLGNWNKKGE